MTTEVTALLMDIETSLRGLKLWQQNPIGEKALKSCQPFCIDTMTFPQWLQFVMLPRMRELLDEGSLLPENCQVGPMAEEYFKPLGFDADHLVASLYYLDRQLSRR